MASTFARSALAPVLLAQTVYRRKRATPLADCDMCGDTDVNGHLAGSEWICRPCGLGSLRGLRRLALLGDQPRRPE